MGTLHLSRVHDAPESPLATPAARGASLRGAWYAVAVLTLANVSGFVDRQILNLLVRPMKRDLQVTDTEISLLMGLGFVVFYSVLGLPIGRWVDRGHRPRIVALGIALWSVMTALTGKASTYTQLFLARIGVGVGEATLGPAAVSIIADRFPRRQLGTAMSIYMMGTFLGSGAAYVLGAYVVGRFAEPGRIMLPVVGEIYRWQAVFFFVGLPGLLIALLALTIREPRATGEAIVRHDAVVPFREFLAYVKQNARTISALSLGFACSASVNYGVGAWLATFLIRAHGWNEASAGTLQGVLTALLGPAGVLLGGRLTDRWARQGHIDAPLRVGMVGALGMLIFAGLYPIVPSSVLAALLLVPVNIFAALPWGAANAAIAEAMPPRLRGQGSAVYQLVVNLVSGILGPTAVALLTDHVFGGEAGVRWSLVTTTVIGMSATIALLAWGRGAFVRTVRAVQT
jgi:MFS family permease